jgi:sugar lactone lactonase YvrE
MCRAAFPFLALISICVVSICLGCSTEPESSVEDLTANGRFRANYPVSAQYPEGGAFDATDEVFYVGSLGDGSVHRIDVGTGRDDLFFKETAAGKWWTLGMDVDDDRGNLWVCAMDDSKKPRVGRIWIFDLETGERIQDHKLTDVVPDATCTDVAVTEDGVGYVGDREQGNIYRVDLEDGASLFTKSALLKGHLAGQNSMVVLPDQSALLSVVYLLPALVRVDLETGEAKKVKIDGKFSDLTPLAGADGLTMHQGRAYVAFTTNLIRLTPTDESWTRATSKWEHVKNGMTDVISTPGGLYLLNGQAVRFALKSKPDPFQLARYSGNL